MPPRKKKESWMLTDEEIAKLSPKQREDLIRVLERTYEEKKRLREELVSRNPFYFFEPSTGEINEFQRRFLLKWLKEEDIPAAVDGQKDALLCDSEIILAAGGNQGLWVEEEILTGSGFKKIKDVTPADVVYDEKGQPRKIEYLVDRGERDCYRLTFDDGASLVVDDEHLWCVKNQNRRFKRNERPNSVYGSWIIKDTKWIVERGLNPRPKQRIAIPVCSPVCFPHRHVLVHPYLMGCLLGDGSLSSGVVLTTADPEIISRIEEFGYDVSGMFGRYGYRVRKLRQQIIHYGLLGKRSWEKSVPEDYLINDVESRLELLRGLLDTDGTIDKGKTYFISVSEQLADDVVWIVKSLGGKAKVKERQTYFDSHGEKKAGRVSYLVTIKLQGINPFWVKRKADKFYNICRTKDRILYNIEPMGKLPSRCIKTTSPGGLFIAKDFIVTHNSGKSTYGAIEDFIDVTKQIPAPMQSYYPAERVPKKTPFHVRVVGVDNKQLLNTVIPAYRYWAPRDFLRNGKWDDSFSAEQKLLTLQKSGKVYGTIEFMTNAMDVESFQGPPKDKVGYDEEPLYSIYKENLMRFVTADKLRIRFRMTPTKGISWVKTEIFDKRDSKRISCFKLPTSINPKANLEVVEEILGGLDSYDERKMRLLGDFISLSGLVYGNLFSRKKASEGGHIVDPFPVGYDDYIVFRGGDPHNVTPSYFVEAAVDREENVYVIGLYYKAADTSVIKDDLAQRVKTMGADKRGLRLGPTRVDASCDSTLHAFDGRNIFLELSRGKNAMFLQKSSKYTGSINVGVDLIKKYLRGEGGKRLYFFDTPEVWKVVEAIESLEREQGLNEEKQGMRDKIAEGRWHAHAALRYLFQSALHWVPPVDSVPEHIEERYI